LQRGFKTKAEAISEQMRAQLGLGPIDALCPWKVAEHLGIHVFDVKDLSVPANDVEHLTNAGSDSWSGFAIRESGLVGVVLNTGHQKPRLRNTLMHEISHIYLKHVGSRVDISESGLLLVSDFSRDQEDEANWLSGALLLPREALLTARRAKQSVSQICEDFGVSSELCNWRLRMTAVDMQLKRGRSKAA
jgi:Zn-dependent peptidase ImmA (M78 family)